ncbi:sensor histidine kinase [Cryobacterium tepidiphilum]|nr:sensor histidine kinase [Cryobacterium tepidiphilum]
MNAQPALLRALGVAMIAVVVTMAAVGDAGFAAPGLAVAVGVFAASAAYYLLAAGLPAAAALGLFVLVAGSLVVAYAIDVTSTAVGMFLLGAFAALREPRRLIAAALAAAIVAYDVVQLSAGEPLVSVFATDAGVAFFLLVGRLVKRERDQREQVAALLAEAESRKHLDREASVVAERGRMARELHDVLAHTLSGLTLHLEAARLLAGRPGTDPALHDAVDDAHRLARAGLQEARRAVGALRGEELPGAALIPQLVEEHRLAAAGPCTLTVTGTPVALSAEAELALYRATQEALSNVRKHARAAAADVSLRWEGDRVVLHVEDHGSGTPAAAGEAGYGLTGMAERATLLGAELETGRTDAGYRVRLSVPYASNRREPAAAESPAAGPALHDPATSA